MSEHDSSIPIAKLVAKRDAVRAQKQHAAARAAAERLAQEPSACAPTEDEARAARSALSLVQLRVK